MIHSPPEYAGPYHQFDMMAFPENHHASSNLEAITNTVVAGWKAIKHFVTGKKETASTPVNLPIPTNFEIRQTSLFVYIERYRGILLTSNFNSSTMSIRQCVQEICHIFNSLSKFPITTKSVPFSLIHAEPVIYDKHLHAMRKVISRYISLLLCYYSFTFRALLSGWSLSFTVFKNSLQRSSSRERHASCGASPDLSSLSI